MSHKVHNQEYYLFQKRVLIEQCAKRDTNYIISDKYRNSISIKPNSLTFPLVAMKLEGIIRVCFVLGYTPEKAYEMIVKVADTLDDCTIDKDDEKVTWEA